MRMANPSAPGFDGLRLRHWRPELRADGSLVLRFDRADAPVNAIVAVGAGRMGRASCM